MLNNYRSTRSWLKSYHDMLSTKNMRVKTKTKTSVTIWNCPCQRVCKQQCMRIYESIHKPVLGRNEMSTSTCSGLLHPPNHLVYRIAVCVRIAIQLGGRRLDVSDLENCTRFYILDKRVYLFKRGHFRMVFRWFFKPELRPMLHIDGPVRDMYSIAIYPRGKRRRATSM